MPSTVMVVDDERVAAETLGEALGGMGYEVVAVAHSALACMAAAERHPPDLVLMDINLGSELDGIDLAQMLRERFDIPVVFLSGYADERTIDRARLAGAHGYLLKPFRWIELKSAIEVALFRHRLERQLRDRERWLNTTLRAIGDAAIAVDPDGKVEFVNAAAVKLLTAREAVVRGQPLGRFIRLLNESTREPVSDPLLHVFESGLVARCPTNTALIAAGRELPVDYSVAPMLDEHGTISGAVAVIKDLTEQRRAQQQIAISDRFASLGVITAGIAHEINNPLTYVLGNIEFLTEELGSLRRLVDAPSADVGSQVRAAFSALESLVHDVHEGARHVAGIVADIRVFSRRDTETKSCDVADRMEWALRVGHSAVARHARVARVYRRVPKARVDEGRLGQIFLNLLLNAAYAMRETDPATNQLTVSIDVEPDAAEQANFIRIEVADTGSGMPADVLKRVFEPFFTTKPPDAGTGLGLAVCQGIVTEMGGDITATSEPGRGARFVVRLPAVDDDATSARPLPELAGIRGRVLVIDDDPRVLSVLCRLLGARHQVVATERAREALDLMRREPEFDVIVCDLIMPDMSGFAFYNEVARRSAELAARIVFLSGGADTEQQTEFFSKISNTMLRKPPVPDQLLLAIELQLTASRHGVRAGDVPS